MTWFAAAARSAERGLPALLEVGSKEQIEEVASFFVRHGIEAPRVDEVHI